MMALIIPAYNEQAYLPICLNSLSNQKYNDFKFILVDNGSTDGTINIMQEFASRSDILTTVVTEEKLGKINALNKGLTCVLNDPSIDRLAFSDADSYFSPNWSGQAASCLH